VNTLDLKKLRELLDSHTLSVDGMVLDIETRDHLGIDPAVGSRVGGAIVIGGSDEWHSMTVQELIEALDDDTPIPAETLERWNREWEDRRAYAEVREARTSRANQAFDAAFRKALKEPE